MSDEAREAAWAEHKARWDIHLNPGLVYQAHHDFDTGFDLGVAEGIRQAREAVGIAFYGYDFGLPGHAVGLSTALAAIVALGGTGD